MDSFFYRTVLSCITYRLEKLIAELIKKWRPFELKVSETGVDIQGATRVTRSLIKNKQTSKELQAIANIISLFQMGPSTGYSVFNDRYAENIVLDLHKICPSGIITGLTLIREMRTYTFISGEIVKITGYCRK